jgi:hypothetical protein
MRSLQELPDLPQNGSLLSFLRSQASPPSGAGREYALGAWELHTHPDLMGRLCELAPGCPLTAAYGVPLLASEGVAAVVALGTDWLAVRIDRLPANIKALEPAPVWTFARGDWHLVDAWQGERSLADGTRVLRGLVSGALSYAASLAGEQPQPRSRSRRRR